VPSHLIRVDLGYVYPPFYRQMLEVLAACAARGADYYWISAFRHPTEQAKKYAQGRTEPGPIITKAPPGYSTHNYGIAADCVFDKSDAPGLQPEWGDAAKYEILAEEGRKRGLSVGVPTVPGGDPGHVQLDLAGVTGRKERSVLVELRGLYVEGRDTRSSLKRTWDRLDELGFGP
jgi:hypothetical protein